MKKKAAKDPRLLPQVMEAIVSMKEKNGSTQKQINDHIAQILNPPRQKLRTVKIKVLKALKRGLESGLLIQRKGKYSLGLDKRDYAIFKKFTKISNPYSDCNLCKRRARRSKQGRRRSRRRGRSRSQTTRRKGGRNSKGRGRRRSIGGERTDTNGSFPGTPEPTDNGRKRRKERRKGQRKGRKRQREIKVYEKRPDPDATVSNTSAAGGGGGGGQESNSGTTQENKTADQGRLESQQSSSGGNGSDQEQNGQEPNQEDDRDCGNPDCLCHIKQEDDSPRSMSGEDMNYYSSSYLN